ncbi:MAG: exonuclease subunit SbcD [Bacteroidota bacterium]
MKILHTADWHLGKRLDHVSRLEEQKEVLKEICEIAEREEVDAVLIAGDLFDQINPSIEALELFYRSLKRLANDGQRAVVGIAGNHDSPDRIEAPVPLAQECGIILTGYPNSKIRPFALPDGIEILQSDKGFIELKLPKQERPLRLLLTPYANEVRLKKYLGHEKAEDSLRQILSEHWAELAKKYCDDQGINILMTHLFMIRKGQEKPEEPDDEKPILTIGGAQEIFTANLPKEIQYVALGHLHRQQYVQKEPYPVVYSSSPLAYSMSEAGQEKYVMLVDFDDKGIANCERIALTKGRTLLRHTSESTEAAIEWLQEHPNSWVELTLISDEYLNADQRKALHASHDGIISIIPRIANPELGMNKGIEVDLSKDIKELFTDYFQYKHDQAPNERILGLLKEVLAEDEE